MRRYLLVAFKVAVSTALIAWLIANADLSEVGNVFGRADRTLLAVAFLLFFVGYMITASRWGLLQKALGRIVPLWSLVESFLVAMFFNNFLPSTMGGDVVRMYDAWRFGNTKTEAVAGVVMDRLLGLAALLAFAVFGLYFVEFSRFGGAQAARLAMVAALSALVVLLVLCFLPAWLTTAVRRLGESLPRALAERIALVSTTIASFQARRATLLAAFGLSLILQANVVLYHWLVGIALGLGVPLTAYFLIVPVAIVVMMLPISINGIGVREGLFVAMLGAYGVTQAEGLAYAWLLYVFILLQGLTGGVVFALRRERIARVS